MAAPTTNASVVTNPGGTGTTITPTLPSHAVGDVIEIFVVNSGITTWSAPAGWSLKRQQASSGNASTGVIGTLLYRRVLPGDTLPLASPVCNLGATVTRSAVALTKRGADLESVHVAQEWLAFASNAGTANPIRPTTVTTLAPDMLVHIYYGSRSATNAPEQTNYTQVQEVINSGIIVNNVSQRTISDQNTSLSNQDASPTSGARWIAIIACTPSPDYSYYRSGSQAFNANGTAVTPALPTGTTASDNRGNKDLIVATAQCAGVAPTPNTPGEWTLIAEWSNTTSGGVTTVRKYLALYDGSLDRQFNRTPSGEIFVYFSVYHNAHQSIPVGTSAVQQNASSTTSTFPALPRTGTKTTVQATCVADATPTFTAPSGWTERNDSQGVTCADQSFNATGSTASASFTLNSASPTLCGLMEMFSVASVITLTLTPAVATLSLTSFAPVVKLQLTPGAGSLSLTTFAPTVTTVAAQQYYRSLTIDADLVPSDQTDFPVLVSFTDVDLKSVSNGGHVASTSGFDILFFSDAALSSQLSHELEKYDPATGEVIAWVKLPTISGSTDTVFYVKYGDASITSSQEDAPDTWSNNYLGVWHLNGASLGTAKNSVTGGASTVSGPVAGSGQLDGGADFTGGASTDSILTDLGIAQPTNATYEIWAKRDGEGGNGFGRMWVKGSVTNSVLQFYNDAITYAPAEVYIFSAQWDSPTLVGNWSIPRPSGSAYHSLAVTYNNSSSSNDPLMYLDGTPATVTERVTPGGTLTDSSAEKFAIGQRHITTNRKWNGQLDEFRVSSVIRSPDWIALRFNNESDAATFMDVGTELEVGDILVTPAATTLVLTRFAPTISVRVNVTPATAFLTLTRFAPSLRLSVAPVTKALTTTSFAPLLRVSITPASPSLSLTTFAPSVAIKITVPSTSLVLSTFAPTVSASANVSVTPTTASLTLTRFAPSLKAIVTPATQSLTLNTFAPKLAEVTTPTTASLVVTAFSPSIRSNTILTPSTASLTLAQFAPALVEQITPTNGSLALTAFAPTVNAQADVTVTPGAQSLTLAEFAPALREQITPAAATLTLTTLTPSLVTDEDVVVTASPANLIVNTFAPALHFTITPASASLIVTTTAPSLRLLVQPGTASLVITTFQPILADLLSYSAVLTVVMKPSATTSVMSKPGVVLTVIGKPFAGIEVV